MDISHLATKADLQQLRHDLEQQFSAEIRSLITIIKEHIDYTDENFNNTERRQRVADQSLEELVAYFKAKSEQRRLAENLAHIN